MKKIAKEKAPVEIKEETPQALKLKDDYKEHIATYGNFLYINFFGEKLVPQLKNLFSTGLNGIGLPSFTNDDRVL